MTNSTEKVVTLKDIKNVQTEIHQSSDSNNNLDTLVQCLKDLEGISPLLKIFFVCLYSSRFYRQLNFTLIMKMSLQDFFSGLYYESDISSYPELITVDATYKLNEFRMSLYLLLIVDGNEQSEIIRMYLT